MVVFINCIYQICVFAHNLPHCPNILIPNRLVEARPAILIHSLHVEHAFPPHQTRIPSNHRLRLRPRVFDPAFLLAYLIYLDIFRLQSQVFDILAAYRLVPFLAVPPGKTVDESGLAAKVEQIETVFILDLLNLELNETVEETLQHFIR